MTPENKKPNLERTLIEGIDILTPQPPALSVSPTSQSGFHKLTLDNAKKTNPYQTKTGPAPSSDLLPDHNSNVPLGSGVVAGVLGSGGMAKVYKVWNEKLEVFRAVKVLLPHQQKDLASRFETEAKITVKLHHPNIVEIYSVGDYNTLPFIEMEFIDGESLEALLARAGKLPESVCSSIAISVARALNYAHSQNVLLYGKTYHGIIHRDLKPANIMISKQGQIKLMDFGIARPTETSLHTVDGNIVGTLQYLSPEQLDGQGIDSRSDLYTFGAILYEMLTGTKTFPQDTITNLMKKKAMNEFRRFTDFNFPVDSKLAKIAQKCLQLSSKNRYDTAGTLLTELDAAHKSITAQPPEAVMHNYCANPAGFSRKNSSGSKRLTTLLTKPAILIPLIGAPILIALIVLLLLTGPKGAASPSTTTAKSNQTVALTQPAVVQEPAFTPGSTTALDQQATISANDQSVPLTPATTPQPAVIEKLSATTPTITKAAPRPPTPRIAASAPAASPKPAKVDPAAIKLLMNKYNTTDLLKTIESAIGARDFKDAARALEAYTPVPQTQIAATLLQIELFIETEQYSRAQALLESSRLNDAQYEFLYGRFLQSTGGGKAAVEHFQAALTKPGAGLRNRNAIRNDAVYQTAIVYSAIYKQNPSDENKTNKIQAWLVVKGLYETNPTHVRYQKAVAEIGN